MKIRDWIYKKASVYTIHHVVSNVKPSFMKAQNQQQEKGYAVAPLPINLVKLSLLSILFLAFYSVPGMIATRLVKKDRSFKKGGILFLVLFPYLLALYYVLRYSRGKLDLGKLANIRFNKYFPLLLFYDPKGLMSGFKDEDESMKFALKKGDIILRRNAYYLDSLILNQTSFFTHAAICIDLANGEPEIVHAIGATGVSKAPAFKKFIRSEDVAILRLKESELTKFDNHLADCCSFLANKNIELITLKKELSPIGPSGNATKEKKFCLEGKKRNDPQFSGIFSDKLTKTDISLAIEHEKELIEGDPAVPGYAQLHVFSSLNSRKNVFIHECVDVFTKMYEVYKGHKYDYFFDFSDVCKMSCVEFVWYCFKCAFPVHQVMEKHITWFKQFGPLGVYTMVILPDGFVASPAFELVYTSVKKGDKMVGKPELLKHIETNMLNPWRFMFKLAACQTIVISAFLGIYALAKKVSSSRR